MEQRDILKDQLDELGRVMGLIIGNFIGANPSEAPNLSVHECNQQMKDELDIDIDRLVHSSDMVCKQFFAKRAYAAKHFDHLAAYLFRAGEQFLIEDQKTLACQYFSKAYQCVLSAEEKTSTFSMKREGLKNKIEKALNRNQ